MLAESTVEQTGPAAALKAAEDKNTVSRVAVIAVHGVGHAEAGGTARHLADLLLGLGRLKLKLETPAKEQTPAQPEIQWKPDAPAPPPYPGFSTQLIQVPLAAAPVSNREKSTQRTVQVIAESKGLGTKSKGWDRIRYRLLFFWHYLDERRGYIAGVFAEKNPANLAGDLKDRAKLGHEFMRAQLAGYVSEPEGKSYDTIRLETERPADEKATQRTVHLYEAYWADLARPQNSILSFFLAFYQLLLHLGSLSRTAVDYAVLEHYDKRSWRWHAFWQSLAVRFLVLPLTILNLDLLLAGLSGLPLKLLWNHGLIAAFVLGMMALGGMLSWPRFRDAPSNPRLWIAMLVLAFGLGGLAGYVLGRYVMCPDYLLAIEWWLLGGAALFRFVLKPYDEFRRGAARIGLVFYLLSFAGFLYCLWRAAHDPHDPLHLHAVDQAGFWSMQLLMFGVIVSWLGLLFSALCAYVLHFVCLRGLGGAGRAERLRARAALRTGRLTLAASASLFLVLTVFLWTGLYRATRVRLHLHDHIQVTQVPLPGPLAHGFRAVVPTLSDAIRWAHQAGDKPCVEDRIVRLEQLDWSSSMACQRSAALISCCMASAQTLEPAPMPPLPEICGPPPHRRENYRDVDIAQQLDFLEKAARVDVSEEPIQSSWIAPLDNENRIYRLELLTKPNSEDTLDTYADTLMLVTSTAGLHILLISFAIALALLVWAVVPSLLGDPLSLANAKTFNNRLSRQLGDWFSRGLDSTRVITFFLWHAIFTLAFVFGVLGFAYSHGWMDPGFRLYAHYPCLLGIATPLARFMRAMTGDTLHVLKIVGALLAVSGAVIAAAVYQKGRVVLDIVLDVDHYLRTSPLKRTPRARIAERYTSLLRYIAQKKDSEGKPYYTSVVIAAHSLGALISADLLQYLKRECREDAKLDPDLAPLGFRPPASAGQAVPEAIPIYLLTFGNPLRQLLNRFFPHLYWWVREEPDNAYDPLPSAVSTLPPISNSATPDPANHNVRRWVSAYRSGDFVGRSLWLDGWFARTQGKPEEGAYPQTLAVAESLNQSRAEACIGLGGHNNYWDRSAPDMAQMLDELICS